MWYLNLIIIFIPNNPLNFMVSKKKNVYDPETLFLQTTILPHLSVHTPCRLNISQNLYSRIPNTGALGIAL